ncbi:hypothetical protein [Allorhodopirellula heiligendammensis]|uniref:N-acetyltransferase domain-containing protein n=1 Tax=Allorhodopirellula heiligendammensis TaxID=2714739 RepID=A0A5C6C1R1_9BACT|nr:hypothetical protein [Allorhodopirellula heiligendammensis]TWU18513.1 hypothetical protein Poly21_06760 [Allorhodopirellula heiligendammensis]
MAKIRPFQNSDLPGIFEVWMRHWAAARQSPPVSVSILERAVLARAFFRPSNMMVALADERVIAWAHSFADAPADRSGTSASEGDSPPAQPTQDQGTTATIAALCFADEPGIAICDQLLQRVETELRSTGVRQINIGPVRDDRNGYAGLAPVGHGIGIPVSDARTGSLLSRNGYHVARSIDRMAVQTSTYRPPVNRSFLQLRRSTRLDHVPLLPSDHRVTAAMSHFDIERHTLVDHQQQAMLATCEFWLGDPEVQVMESSRAILSLSPMGGRLYNGRPVSIPSKRFVDPESRELSVECQFLISSLVQSLSNRQILTVETAIDRDDRKLIEQLGQLKFECVEQGKQWTKVLS